MLLVDIEQEIQFAYYDDETQKWKEHTGTIKEFLSIFCDYKHINLYKIDYDYLGNYEKQENE